MKTMRALLLPVILAALLAQGCSKSPDLMPMAVGQSTTYAITYGLEKRVGPIVVTRQVPLGGVTGYELTGDQGVSRLAWKGGVLFASETANAFFDPPIPIVAADSHVRHWTGRITAGAVVSQATAELTMKADKLDLTSKTIDTVDATLAIKLPRGAITLDSWFEPGVGMVRQEQRTGDQLVVRLEMLDRPKE